MTNDPSTIVATALRPPCNEHIKEKQIKVNQGRLIIHIGPHKTGTTAVQQALAARAKPTAEDAWAFETFPELKGGIHQLADFLSNNKFAEMESILEQIRGLKRPTILSSENFSRMNSEQVAEFKSSIGRTDVCIVYYLRNPLKRLMSAWVERVKHGYRYTFMEFLAGRLAKPFQDRELNDSVRIQPWVDGFGDAGEGSTVDIHLYDRLDDIATHFFETYLSRSEMQHAKAGYAQVNRSPTAVHVEILRALAGCQTHMMRKDFALQPDLAELRSKVEAILADVPSYMHETEFSLNNPIVAQIEKTLVKNYGQYIRQSFENDMLFEDRKVKWRYLAHEIWFENPVLGRSLLDLREKIMGKYGPAVFDRRLAAI